MLREFNSLPEGLLDLQACELLKALGGPSLIHLKGRKNETVFVSVLLHGNEPVGWDALKQVLANYKPGGGIRDLPRNLSIFIGNVFAAEKGLRRLEGQVDYNRVWPGGDENCEESKMMQQVVKVMSQRKLFVSLDIHNNTGINPHYGCINKTDNEFLRLAHLFRRLVIYFTKPSGVQSLAMSKLCPAITIEAGKAGDKAGVEHTALYIDECLHLYELSDKELHHEEIDLYHTVATVKVPPGYSFSFSKDDEADIHFHQELEKFNFSELQADTVWAEVSGAEIPLEVVNEANEDVRDKYFKVENNRLVSKISVMPAMLTTDRRVISQDCLCYLMERYSL